MSSSIGRLFPTSALAAAALIAGCACEEPEPVPVTPVTIGQLSCTAIQVVNDTVRPARIALTCDVPVSGGGRESPSTETRHDTVANPDPTKI